MSCPIGSAIVPLGIVLSIWLAISVKAEPKPLRFSSVVRYCCGLEAKFRPIYSPRAEGAVAIE